MSFAPHAATTAGLRATHGASKKVPGASSVGKTLAKTAPAFDKLEIAQALHI